MTSRLPMQLPLGLKLRDEATFDNYYAGPNAAIVRAAQALADPQHTPTEPFVYLWGASGSGCSHLLQGACHQMTEAGGLAMYLPLRELLSYGPALLEGMEGVDLLCLDELDALAGQPEWEEALFHLYNRIQQRQGRLLMGAAAAPRVVGFNLADLISRLGWGLVYHLQRLDDDDKQQMLKLRAELRGLQLPDEVARYILSRGARGMNELFAALEDRKSVV